MSKATQRCFVGGQTSLDGMPEMSPMEVTRTTPLRLQSTRLYTSGTAITRSRPLSTATTTSILNTVSTERIRFESTHTLSMWPQPFPETMALQSHPTLVSRDVMDV